MATLTVIGEPLSGYEALVHAAAARDFAAALNAVAPRNCEAALCLAADSPEPNVTSELPVHRLSQRAALLPILWRTSATTGHTHGQFIHSMTPLAPLRTARSVSDPQTSVLIPHALPWVAPSMLPHAESRQFRAFTKRAITHADLILAPSHAVAGALRDVYGEYADIHVLPLAAPTEFEPPENADAAEERRTALKVPDRYCVTTATPDESGRLEWVYEALRAYPALPPMVVLGASASLGNLTVPEDLRDRVLPIEISELSDVGVILSHATVFACPQRVAGAAYELYGALSAGVPVVHSECQVAAELVLDAGVAADSAASFGAALNELCSNEHTRNTAAVLASDRSRAFSWQLSAWQLWELHANL